MAPALLCRESYSRDLTAKCALCDSSLDAAFRLAPKPQILEVLEYL